VPHALRRARARAALPGLLHHRVAISNDRLVRLDGEHVVFCYRDRARGDMERAPAPAPPRRACSEPGAEGAAMETRVLRGTDLGA
jgi:hypothetical protein